MHFETAQSAFEFYYDYINKHGIEQNGTKMILNTGFYINNPFNNDIKTSYRNWKKKYAEIEWKWYLSKDRSVKELKKHAKIWDNMHNGDDIVNSNYGFQWSRGEQLEFVVSELTKNPNSRRAVITIYDGKENNLHSLDTPCTLNITFNVINKRLNMSVLMRSNDLWFGFCNDQYCFSKLQALVAKKLKLDIGWYFHFVNNLHIYSRHFNRNNNG